MKFKFRSTFGFNISQRRPRFLSQFCRITNTGLQMKAVKLTSLVHCNFTAEALLIMAMTINLQLT